MYMFLMPKIGHDDVTQGTPTRRVPDSVIQHHSMCEAADQR